MRNNENEIEKNRKSTEYRRRKPKQNTKIRTAAASTKTAKTRLTTDDSHEHPIVLRLVRPSVAANSCVASMSRMHTAIVQWRCVYAANANSHTCIESIGSVARRTESRANNCSGQLQFITHTATTMCVEWDNQLFGKWKSYVDGGGDVRVVRIDPVRLQIKCFVRVECNAPQHSFHSSVALCLYPAVISAWSSLRTLFPRVKCRSCVAYSIRGCMYDAVVVVQQIRRNQKEAKQLVFRTYAQTRASMAFGDKDRVFFLVALLRCLYSVAAVVALRFVSLFLFPTLHCVGIFDSFFRFSCASNHFWTIQFRHSFPLLSSTTDGDESYYAS